MSITPEQWKRLRTSFEVLVEAAPDEREQILSALHDSDPDLGAEIHRLIAVSDAPGLLDSGLDLDPGELSEILTQFETGLRPGDRLANRFRIESILGSGGMGQVMAAFDELIGEPVAIKTIRPELLAEPKAVDRLKQELQRGRDVTHPNVCRVHDYFVHDAGNRLVPFLTMQLLKGITLFDQLQTAGPLEPEAARAVLLDCAAALDTAHASGVVHRDFKPGNIMLTSQGRQPKGVVMDFGIARPILAPNAGGASQFAGTPGYMSPEQAEGGEIGEASDVYSFAVVACETLTGRKPADGGLAALDVRWRKAIERGLRRDPRQRFRSATELMRSVEPTRRRWIYVAAGAAGLLWAADAASRLKRRTPPQSVAVLSFDSEGGDTEAEVFADGLAENLIRFLSRNNGVRVIPRASAFRFKSSDPDTFAVAKRLSVRYLFAGSVRMRNSRIRVRVQLIDGSSNSVVWSETYDRPASETIHMEEQIGSTALAQMGIVPTDLLQISQPSRNFAAYQAYLHGRYHLNRRQTPALRLAQTYFETAIAADPSLALAHAGFAETLLIMAERAAMSPATALPAAKAAATRSLEADPRLPEAYAVLGFANSAFDHDFFAAERNFKHALRLKPDLVIARQWYSYMLVKVRRFDEAIAEASRAVEIDALSIPAHQNLAAIYWYGRLPAQLDEECRKILELDPNHYFAHIFRGYAHAYLGRENDAAAEVAIGLRDYGRTPNVVRMAGEVFARIRRLPEARALLATLLELRSGEAPVPASYPGFLHAALGEIEPAFTWLETAWREQDPFLAMLHVYPSCDVLRTDPRYADLVRRLGVTGSRASG